MSRTTSAAPRSTTPCWSSATGPTTASSTGRSRTAGARRGAKPVSAAAFTLHHLHLPPPLPPPPPPPPGYFRLIRNKNACGVATLATYPTAARPATRCSPYDDCSSCLAANDNTTATVVDAITGTSNAAPGVVEPCFWCASSESCEAAGGGTAAGHPFHQCDRPTLSKGECVCSQHTGERPRRLEQWERRPIRLFHSTHAPRLPPTDCKGCATPRLSVFEDGNRSGCVWVLNGTLTRDLSLTWPNGTTTTYTNFGASAADRRLHASHRPLPPLQARPRATATRRSRPTGRVWRARRWAWARGFTTTRLRPTCCRGCQTCRPR